jgi:hypothetical protein
MEKEKRLRTHKDMLSYLLKEVCEKLGIRRQCGEQSRKKANCWHEEKKVYVYPTRNIIKFLMKRETHSLS